MLVDIPKDITVQKCEFHYPKSISMRSYNPVVKGHTGQIKKAVQLLLEAKRPMIYTGGGVILSDASDKLTKLTRMLGYPITQTLMGLGAYPATDRQFLGMLGMHGTYEANMAMQDCDVLLAIGARFDDRVIGNPDALRPGGAQDHPYRHRSVFDFQAGAASMCRSSAMCPTCSTKSSSSSRRPKASLTRSAWRPGGSRSRNGAVKNSLKYKQGSDIIMPQYVVEKLYEVTGGDAFVTSDVGQHQMWAAQYYKFDKPRRWINSGGLGTMGFGLPAAMGVRFANPKATVACVTGEGSIQMNIQELSTCKQFHLPIKILCLNNGYLGMVRQWQQMFHGNRYAESYVDALPDFVKLAEAYGHVGIRVDKPADVEPALREAFVKHKNELVFLDFLTDQTANVFPMVAAGKGLSEMILAEEL